jgi:hypothetical protein
MAVQTMNRIEEVKGSERRHWKDAAAGWRIFIAKCEECGRTETSYTLLGTRKDAERFAGDSEYNVCDKCS